MASTTFSSRQFNQDASGAKRAAAEGPVFVTTRGEPSHVLLSIEEYRRMLGSTPPDENAGARRSIVDMLAMAESDEIDFDPPRSRELPKIPDLD